MAKAIAAPKSKGGGISLIAVLVLTLLGGGAGGLFGMQVPHLLNSNQDAKPGAEHGKDTGPLKSITRTLAPITTNLASPPNTWIRLEAAAVLTGDLGKESDPLLAEITEDIVAYLRTVPLEQLEGPSGFQNLREDLDDRVRVRSKGQVSDLLIQGLVIE